VLEGGETANLLRKFSNRVEGHIEFHKAGHLADDIRHMHKLVVRDVKEFQKLEAGKVSGQLLYPVVLKPQVRELRYAVETSVVQVHDAITRQVESV
jgi:hypothetical protein